MCCKIKAKLYFRYFQNSLNNISQKPNSIQMLGTSSLYRIEGIHLGSQHLRHVDVRRDESVPVYLCAANQDSRISFNCANEQSRWISLQWLALRSARLNSALSQFRAVMGLVLSFCLALGSLSAQMDIYALLSTTYICSYIHVYLNDIII